MYADIIRLRRGKYYDWLCSPGLINDYTKEVKAQDFTTGKNYYYVTSERGNSRINIPL
jgi:hypothetical protein